MLTAHLYEHSLLIHERMHISYIHLCLSLCSPHISTYTLFPLMYECTYHIYTHAYPYAHRTSLRTLSSHSCTNAHIIYTHAYPYAHRTSLRTLSSHSWTSAHIIYTHMLILMLTAHLYVHSYNKMQSRYTRSSYQTWQSDIRSCWTCISLCSHFTPLHILFIPTHEHAYHIYVYHIICLCTLLPSFSCVYMTMNHINKICPKYCWRIGLR
jgi:hypothetical protein